MPAMDRNASAPTAPTLVVTDVRFIVFLLPGWARQNDRPGDPTSVGLCSLRGLRQIRSTRYGAASDRWAGLRADRRSDGEARFPGAGRSPPATAGRPSRGLRTPDGRAARSPPA